jgi:hypothetical protein
MYQIWKVRDQTDDLALGIALDFDFEYVQPFLPEREMTLTERASSKGATEPISRSQSLTA